MWIVLRLKQRFRLCPWERLERLSQSLSRFSQMERKHLKLNEANCLVLFKTNTKLNPKPANCSSGDSWSEPESFFVSENQNSAWSECICAVRAPAQTKVEIKFLVPYIDSIASQWFCRLSSDLSRTYNMNLKRYWPFCRYKNSLNYYFIQCCEF